METVTENAPPQVAAEPEAAATEEEKKDETPAPTDEVFKDPGTPLEAEENGTAEVEEGENNDSSDDDDDIQIHIGDIKSNVQFRPTGNAAQKGVKAGGPTGKLDVDATAEINGTPIYDLDLANMEEKPWRKPGSDITDYFNYGFTEETWNMYCERQRKLRSEYGPLANKQLFSSLMVGSSTLTRGQPILSTNHQSSGNLITNLVDKSPQLTPMFRKDFTSGGRMSDHTPHTIPTVNLAAPKVSSISVIGSSGSAGMAQQPPIVQTPTVLVTTTPAVPTPATQPHLLNLEPATSYDEADGPPGESPARPGTATPPPGVDSAPPTSSGSESTHQVGGGNFTTGVPAPSQAQPIQSLGVVNMSVPPPGFSGADISVPPPRFNVPPPFNLPPRPMPPGIHPTNVPPPGMGPPGFNPPPPGIMVQNMGRGGPPNFTYRPMGPRPPANVMRAYAGFQPPPQDGERSPASYSDQSSDMDDRDYADRDRRMGSRSRRPDHGYRSSRRSSRSPPGYDRRRRGRDDHRSGRYERSPDKERERSTRSSRRRGGSPEKEEERKREEKSSSSKKRSSSTTKTSNEGMEEDEGKERRRKRRRKEEEPTEEGSSRGSKKIKEEPRDEGEKEKEPRKSKKSSKEKKADA